MPDPITSNPPDPAQAPSTSPTPATPAAPADPDERFGRYDANVQLILRRMADADRTRKPRWWWQSH